MHIFLIGDPATLATLQQQGLGLGFSNSLIHRLNFITNTNLQISAAVFDAVAPPPVKSNSTRTIRRNHIRKKRRTRRRSFSGEESDDSGEGFCFFADDGDGDGDSNGNWTFGGGGGGNWSGGGKGWNFGKFGGQNWDESSSWSSSSKFAYGFVYEVIYWIALSNCLHFAFEKVSRTMADSEREKVTMRLSTVC